jgi:1-phosphofructokinase
MILTLTLNPAVDQTLWLERLTVGRVNRAIDSQLDPAGKGINASRMCHRIGWPTTALGFLGGEVGHLVQRTLDDENVPNHFLRVEGQTRINVTLVDRSTGYATSIYGQGPHIGSEALARLDELFDSFLQPGRVLVLAGSLPPGVPENLYARLTGTARRHEVRTIVDAEGEALRLAVAECPTLIKPNVSEAERLLGRKLPNQAAVRDAACELAERLPAVVISMGMEGAVFAQGGRAWHAMPPKVQWLSTVGSGDSMVAGLAVEMARGHDLLEGLRLGTAAGAATAMSPGTSLGSLDEVLQLLPKVQIAEIPPGGD